MIDLELWQKRKRELKWTYDTIAKNANISKRTVADIFRGFTTDPRIETVQAIEKALGLSSLDWTAEEKAQGVGRHPTYLSDAEVEWLELRSDIIAAKGNDYLNVFIDMIKAIVKNK